MPCWNVRLPAAFLVNVLALFALPPQLQAAPSVEELAPGVSAIVSPARFGYANTGWLVFDDHVMLIGAPHPDVVAQSLAAIEKQTRKPVRGAILTHVGPGELSALPSLARRGIAVVAHREAAQLLRAALARDSAAASGLQIREFTDRLVLEDPRQRVEIVAVDPAARPGAAAVYLPGARVLFAGALCSNGPRAVLEGNNTARWIQGLRALRKLPIKRVVPGFGTPGDATILERQERFLLELRRQVGYLVAQGRSLEDACSVVRIAPEWLVWMPYDMAQRPDIEHVYRELTVPQAPFLGWPFAPGDPKAKATPKPRALALVGDRNHDPAHLEAGLARAFEEARIDARITVDPRALSAENLKEVRLFVILRDGANWPGGADGPMVTWMTPEQESALVRFVDGGGGLLVLHNATALYPEKGPYLNLVAGTYTGHGPLERFRVSVVNRSHPITQGVADFELADEQHTPIPDRSRVDLLLENRSEGGIVAAAGWAYTQGLGRVAYLANGHTRDAMAHPEFQKLLRNAMRWCLSKEEK